MRKVRFVFLFFVILCGGLAADGQSSQPQPGSAAVEREVREFFNSYGEDLRQHRREAIVNRYDSRGYYRVGNGSKSLVSFADVRNQYLTKWTGPKSFEWKDLSIEILSDNAAAVTGLFDWQNDSGWTVTASYTGVLTKQSGKWAIRIEDESVSTQPWKINHLIGDRTKSGPFKYVLRIPPGTSIAAHRHSVDQKITVISGRKFVLMGDLATARAQLYEAGASFVIPAGTWHVEWWEAETQVVAEGVGPMLTEFASPASPRKH
jgi:hypothetical protein